MLPTLYPSERLGTWVSNEAVRLADAERLINRHGHDVADACGLSITIVRLFDTAEDIFDLAGVS